MHIEFEKIRFKNLLSYGNSYEEFIFDKGLNLIKAPNGSGKSSLIDAISFALFGQPYRNIKMAQLINKYNEKGLVVELFFKINSDNYIIKRGLKPNLFSFTKNGEEIDLLSSKKLNQEEINKIIGINYSLFKNIVCVATTFNKPFLTLSSWDKRNLIENIFNIDIIALMLKEVKKRNTLNKTQQKIDIVALGNIEENIADTKKYISDINNSKNKYDENKRKEIEKYTNAIDKFSDEILTHYKNLKIAEKKTEELHKVIASKSLIESELNELVFQKRTNDTRKTEINDKLKSLNGKTLCPLCNSELHSKHAKNYISSLTDEFKKLENNDLTLKINKLNDKKDEIKKAEELDSKIFKMCCQENTNIKNKENTIEMYKTSIDKLLNDEFSVDISSYQKKLSELIDRQKIMNDESCVINDKIALDDILTNILGDDGVKIYFFRKLLPILNNKVNEYLKKFELDILLEFDEMLNANITTGRYSMDYNQFSCGERSRIDVAILLSFFDISRSISNWSCSVLFMDEILDSGVDSDGVAQFISVLYNTVHERNGNELGIYLISHKLADVSVNWTHEITIEKKGMFSNIKKN